MHLIDIFIILSYIVLTLGVGIWVSRLASKGLDSYFLGGKSIKWYFLGLSNGSGMFDVSGTAWMVAVLFLYGVKSFMFMWMWPVWNQIFVMMFLAIWIRKSNIMTGSEWILTRFGNDRAGKASHIIVALFAVIAAVGFIAYFFVGVGKFMTIILPWNMTVQVGTSILLESEQSYAMLLIALTTLYTIKGGMFSVVATEVLQYGIMVLAGIAVATYAFFTISDVEISAIINAEWKNVFFGKELTGIWSEKQQAFNDLVDQEAYKMFAAFIGMTLFKGFFASVAGPVPGYDMQRILSTRTVKEAAYMSGFTNLILFIPRYLLVAGIVVIALVELSPGLLAKQDLGWRDLELLLPQVINFHVPVGIKGLLLAGLLAAFMSTFSAFVNAGPAYIVNDLYKKYFKPDASDRHYVKVSYVASTGVVLLGVILGLFADTINSLTLWITSALYGGYVAANFLKWVWWRFNGWGYFYGMVAGLLVATLQYFLEQNKDALDQDTFLYELVSTPAIYLFPLIFGVSLLGCVVGTLLTKPTDSGTLERFYKTVKPWGFWNPVCRKIQQSDSSFTPNKSFWLDMLNVSVGVIWQSSMILIPIYLVIREYSMLGVAMGVFVLTSILLKFTWLDRLDRICK